MITLITENLATILISALLLAVAGGISINLIKKKKNPKIVGCGCGCSGCQSAFICHKK